MNRLTLVVVCFFGLVLLASPGVHAVVTCFANSTCSFSEATNWDPSGPPSATDLVYVYGNVTVPSGDYDAKFVHVLSGGNLTVEGGLHLTDNMTVAGTISGTGNITASYLALAATGVFDYTVDAAETMMYVYTDLLGFADSNATIGAIELVADTVEFSDCTTLFLDPYADVTFGYATVSSRSGLLVQASDNDGDDPPGILKLTADFYKTSSSLYFDVPVTFSGAFYLSGGLTTFANEFLSNADGTNSSGYFYVGDSESYSDYLTFSCVDCTVDLTNVVLNVPFPDVSASEYYQFSLSYASAASPLPASALSGGMLPFLMVDASASPVTLSCPDGGAFNLSYLQLAGNPLFTEGCPVYALQVGDNEGEVRLTSPMTVISDFFSFYGSLFIDAAITIPGNLTISSSLTLNANLIVAKNLSFDYITSFTPNAFSIQADYLVFSEYGDQRPISGNFQVTNDLIWIGGSIVCSADIDLGGDVVISSSSTQKVTRGLVGDGCEIGAQGTLIVEVSVTAFVLYPDDIEALDTGTAYFSGDISFVTHTCSASNVMFIDSIGCVACSGSGLYCNESMLEAECPSGYICPSGYPEVCPAGYLCNQTGLGAPLSCPVGYYCNESIATICPAGSYCPGNSSEPIPAAPGTYVPDSGANSSIDCPIGTSCPDTGMISPVDCALGYYSNMTGSAACIACPAGSYQNSSGSTSCLVCPVGYYCPTAHTTEPIACDPASLCPYNGTIGICSAGEYHNGTTCVTSPAGYYADGMMKYICPVGYICPAGSATPTACVAGTTTFLTGQTECVTCPVGSVCPGGASSYAAAGTYAPDTGMTESLPCPVGTYCDDIGMSVPTTCPVGSYCPVEGAVAPIACPLAYFCASTGLTEIPSCDTGYYMNSTGSCELAPPGHWSNDSMLTDCPSLKICPGYGATPQYCPHGKVPNDDQTDCSLCPAGFYCAGSISYCPAGFYCPLGTITPYGCPAEHYCPGNSSTPVDCPDNYYSAPNSTSCTVCPSDKPNCVFTDLGCVAGTYQFGSDSTDCDPCPEGYYCPNSTTKYRCMPGFYCPLSSVAPTACPVNTSQPYYAKASCNACPSHTVSSLNGMYCVAITNEEGQRMYASHGYLRSNSYTLDERITTFSGGFWVRRPRFYGSCGVLRALSPYFDFQFCNTEPPTLTFRNNRRSVLGWNSFDADLNEWTHLFFTVTADRISLYVNGQSILLDSPHSETIYADQVYISYLDFSSLDTMDLVIYGSYLTPQEVLSVYANRPLSTHVADMLAYFPMASSPFKDLATGLVCRAYGSSKVSVLVVADLSYSITPREVSELGGETLVITQSSGVFGSTVDVEFRQTERSETVTVAGGSRSLQLKMPMMYPGTVSVYVDDDKIGTIKVINVAGAPVRLVHSTHIEDDEVIFGFGRETTFSLDDVDEATLSVFHFPFIFNIDHYDLNLVDINNTIGEVAFELTTELSEAFEDGVLVFAYRRGVFYGIDAPWMDVSRILNVLGAVIPDLPDADEVDNPSNDPSGGSDSDATNRCEVWAAAQDDDWLDDLPYCPVTPTLQKSQGVQWTIDLSDEVASYHPNAFVCLLSDRLSGSHGLRCCYDEDGELISSGEAAGRALLVHPSVTWSVNGATHEVDDLEAYDDCCLASDNCQLYLSHRPPVTQVVIPATAVSMHDGCVAAMRHVSEVTQYDDLPKCPPKRDTAGMEILRENFHSSNSLLAPFAAQGIDDIYCYQSIDGSSQNNHARSVCCYYTREYGNCKVDGCEETIVEEVFSTVMAKVTGNERKAMSYCAISNYERVSPDLFFYYADLRTEYLTVRPPYLYSSDEICDLYPDTCEQEDPEDPTEPEDPDEPGVDICGNFTLTTPPKGCCDQPVQSYRLLSLEGEVACFATPDSAQCCYSGGVDKEWELISSMALTNLPEDGIMNFISTDWGLLYYCCRLTTSDSCAAFLDPRTPPSSCRLPLPPRWIYGDPHLVTHGNITYSFQAVGDFLLVGDLNATFSVAARFTPAADASGASVTSGVSVTSGDDTFSVQLIDSSEIVIFANDDDVEASTLPYRSGLLRMSMEDIGGDAALCIDVTDGPTVCTMASGEALALAVSMDNVDDGCGSIYGLLGTYCSTTDNNFVLPTNPETVITNTSSAYLHDAFGEHFRLAADNDLMPGVTNVAIFGEFAQDPVVEHVPNYEAKEMSAELEAAAIAACTGLSNYDQCIFDISVLGTVDGAASAVVMQATQDEYDAVSQAVSVCGVGYAFSSNSICEECPAGYYSDEESAAPCYQCADNAVSAPGSASCTVCGLLMTPDDAGAECVLAVGSIGGVGVVIVVLIGLVILGFARSSKKKKQLSHNISLQPIALQPAQMSVSGFAN